MQTTTTLSSRGLTTVDTTLVSLVTVSGAEYTKLLITDDSRMMSIDHNHFVVLVLTILANPV
jgi:hypothetical protein